MIRPKAKLVGSPSACVLTSSGRNGSSFEKAEMKEGSPTRLET